jgi:hypothetical protein
MSYWLDEPTGPLRIFPTRYAALCVIGMMWVAILMALAFGDAEIFGGVAGIILGAIILIIGLPAVIDRLD